MNIPSGLANISLRTWLLRFVLFALMWWILTDGAMDSWPIGLPVVLLATLVSVMLMPPLSWSLRGILRFIPYFLWYSIRGGVDVARRAMHPRLPILPGLYDYRFRLPPGLSRVFMANTVSLLPGTLSVELEEEILRIHVLDETVAIDEELNVLENRLADIFGLELMEAINGEV
jgi:multicomponent Na+:H+ antiporter subunit E